MSNEDELEAWQVVEARKAWYEEDSGIHAGLTLNEYQKKALTTALGLARGEGNSPLKGAVYGALGLAGEAGEVAEKVKKAWRNETGLDGQKGLKLALELGDVLWYLAATANSIGYTLEEVAEFNLNKLKDRQERDKLASEGDSR